MDAAVGQRDEFRQSSETPAMTRPIGEIYLSPRKKCGRYCTGARERIQL